MKPKSLRVLAASAAILASLAAQPVAASDSTSCPYSHDSTHTWYTISVANFASHRQADQAVRTDRNGDGVICYLDPPREHATYDRYRLRDNQI